MLTGLLLVLGCSSAPEGSNTPAQIPLPGGLAPPEKGREPPDAQPGSEPATGALVVAVAPSARSSGLLRVATREEQAETFGGSLELLIPSSSSPQELVGLPLNKDAVVALRAERPARHTLAPAGRASIRDALVARKIGCGVLAAHEWIELADHPDRGDLGLVALAQLGQSPAGQAETVVVGAGEGALVTGPGLAERLVGGMAGSAGEPLSTAALVAGLRSGTIGRAVGSAAVLRPLIDEGVVQARDLTDAERALSYELLICHAETMSEEAWRNPLLRLLGACTRFLAKRGETDQALVAAGWQSSAQVDTERLEALLVRVQALGIAQDASVVQLGDVLDAAGAQTLPSLLVENRALHGRQGTDAP